MAPFSLSFSLSPAVHSSLNRSLPPSPSFASPLSLSFFPPFLPLFPPSLRISLDLCSTDTKGSHKEANKSAAVQVRLFIKKFLLHPAQQSIRRRRSGLRSKNLFALPPPSPPPSLPFTRYCFTILYYIARYVEFRLFGFNERLAVPSIRTRACAYCTRAPRSTGNHHHPCVACVCIYPSLPKIRPNVSRIFFSLSHQPSLHLLHHITDNIQRLYVFSLRLCIFKSFDRLKFSSSKKKKYFRRVRVGIV